MNKNDKRTQALKDAGLIELNHIWVRPEDKQKVLDLDQKDTVPRQPRSKKAHA